MCEVTNRRNLSSGSFVRPAMNRAVDGSTPDQTDIRDAQHHMQRCRPTAPHLPGNSTCRTAPKRRPTPEHAAPITVTVVVWGHCTMCIRTTPLQVVTRKQRHRPPCPNTDARHCRPESASSVEYKLEGKKGTDAARARTRDRRRRTARRSNRTAGLCDRIKVVPDTTNPLIALPLLPVIITVASSSGI